MRMLDLFSGIGGFALSAKWAFGKDLEIVGFCEIDDYCHKILNKNFPDVPIYEDIKELDGKKFKNIDLITGGFPCQDISVAGRGAGLEGERSSLWFELLRIIRDIRPRYALVENVPMLTSRGGTRVVADLAKIGYDTEWQIISAAEVGAWHLRKRIWIVAYPRNSSNRTDRRQAEKENRIQEINRKERQSGELSGTSGRKDILADSDDKRLWTRLDRSNFRYQKKGRARNNNRVRRETNVRWNNFKTTKNEKMEFSDPDSRLRRRRRTVQQSREDQKRKLHPQKEREESYDIRSKTVRRSTVRGKEKDVSNSDSRRLEGSCEEQGRTRDVVRGSRKGSQGEVPDSNSDRRKQVSNRVLSQGDGIRSQIYEQKRDPNKAQKRDVQTSKIDTKNNRTVEPSVGDLVDGLPVELAGYWLVEPEGIPRVTTKVKDRINKLKGLGNAIVPQCVYPIMVRLKELMQNLNQ